MDGGTTIGTNWAAALDLDDEDTATLRRTYGHAAEDALDEDPYLVAGPGFGVQFSKADKFAVERGVALQDPIRVRAGLYEVMRSATASQGHCLLLAEELAVQTAKLLGVPMAAVVPVLEGLDGSELVRIEYDGTDAYAPVRLHYAEKGIARRLRAMSQSRPPWQISNVAAALEAADRFTGKPLKPSQVTAFDGVLRSKISVITGGPGVGKTMLLKAVMHAIRSAGTQPRQAAPTGRAAMNMIDATGMNADTMHILLGRSEDGRGFRHGRDNLLDCDAVVLDETSMADVLLLWAVLQAMPAHAALILIGDVDQLEPVGPGRPFADIIASGAVPVFRLTEIQRQAKNSQIIVNCHRINAGEVPLLETNPAKSDFLFYRAESTHAVLDRVVDLASRGLPALLSIDATRDVQVLSAMNVRDLGANHLQAELRNAINTDRDEGVSTRYGTFSIGDKVMHTKNNYVVGVRNGEIGVVVDIHHMDSTATIDFSGRHIRYDSTAMTQLKFGYAVSVHKSQGSEYPAVVMPIVREQRFMLTRRLLLTGCSRARRMMVLVGHVDALAAAVKNVRNDNRRTQLRTLLEAA